MKQVQNASAQEGILKDLDDRRCRVSEDDLLEPCRVKRNQVDTGVAYINNCKPKPAPTIIRISSGEVRLDCHAQPAKQ